MKLTDLKTLCEAIYYATLAAKHIHELTRERDIRKEYAAYFKDGEGKDAE